MVFGLYSLAYIRGDVALGGLGSETYVRGLMTREFTSGGAYVRVTGDLTSRSLHVYAEAYVRGFCSRGLQFGDGEVYVRGLTAW